MTDDRLLNALKALIASALPQLAYLAPVRYRVVAMSGGLNITGEQTRVELQIIQSGSIYPDVLPVDMWPGLAGSAAKLTPGAIVLVSWIEGNPDMPIVTHFSTKDDPCWRPVNIQIDATTTITIGEGSGVTQPLLPLIQLGATGALAYPVVRAGVTSDLLFAGPFMGYALAGSAKVRAGGPSITG